MTENQRLRLMQRSIMGFGSTKQAETEQTSPARAQKTASPQAIIAQLRAALIAEVRRRTAAEARLKSVLDQIAKSKPAASPSPRTRLKIVKSSRTAPEGVEAIEAIGGDDNEEGDEP
jgi:hypothetical protein